MYGSPPQVRGKRLQDATVKIKDRITPAGAGKTILFRQQINITQDHPRRCGENLLALVQSIGIPGSPPQVRGKHSSRQTQKSRDRITPAGAGKTAVYNLRQRVNEDHPRRCGENRESLNYATRDIGSPPQVRGKPRRLSIFRARYRITPAGAGKTQLRIRKLRDRWDHPRRCGENRVSLTTVMVQEGSPPQVRGKPQVLQGIGEVIGITPAGAGKTAYNRMRREDR